MSLAPLSVIPPPSAVVSLGLATVPNSMFLSSTVNVVESIVVVDPSTVKFPLTVNEERFPTVVILDVPAHVLNAVFSTFPNPTCALVTL